MNHTIIPNLTLENAEIMFGTYKNFSGVERKDGNQIVNAKGNRNFAVKIDNPQMAQQLLEDDWNIKVRPANKPGDDSVYWLPVSVGYNFRPPIVNMVSGRKLTPLYEETVGCLDRVNIISADLVIHPSRWTNRMGESGIKAYLEEGYFNVEPRPFDTKYEDYDR